MLTSVEDVVAAAGASAELAHGWLLRAVAPISLGQAESILREPAAAVPQAAAGRLGTVRLYAVSYLACQEGSDFVAEELPQGEQHSSVWLERPEGLHLFVSFGDANSHDVGFELLAALGELLVPRLSDEEFARYSRLVERELREGAAGEIDDDALEARNSARLDYVGISLASTLAEYMHALWHDVDLRHGPEHLPAKFLRRRFDLLQEWFPPNAGYELFRSSH